MPKFFVDYTLTEITRQRVVIEADSAEEAQSLVDEYEADLSESWQIESMQYSVDNVAITGKMAED